MQTKKFIVGGDFLVTYTAVPMPAGTYNYMVAKIAGTVNGDKALRRGTTNVKPNPEHAAIMVGRELKHNHQHHVTEMLG